MLKLEVLSHPAQGTAKPNPILFVHGAWHTAECWQETFLPYFAARGYHTHALSLRGHGNSANDRLLRLTRLRNYVQDVRQVVETFDAPPILIGHSMGGGVLQKYLEKYDAAAAVLLAALPPHGVLFITLRVLRSHPIPLLKANLQLRLYPLVANPNMASWFFYADNLPAEVVTERHKKLQDESYLAFLDMLLLDRPRPKRVKARGTSLLILGGEQDRIFPAWETRRMAKAYDLDARLFPMPHNLMQERGWEDVADTMLAWLAQQGL